MSAEIQAARLAVREALRHREQAKVELLRAVRTLQRAMPAKVPMLLRRQAG